MDTKLKIISTDLGAEDLQNLTRDLAKTLNKETDVAASLPEGTGDVGDKGDPITLGMILLAALEGGAVAALFGVLKAYFERKPLLTMEFERQDGQKFKIQAEHLDENQIAKTVELANDFLRG